MDTPSAEVPATVTVTSWLRGVLIENSPESKIHVKLADEFTLGAASLNEATPQRRPQRDSAGFHPTAALRNVCAEADEILSKSSNFGLFS
jgi:hypothetical protein